MTPDDDLQRQMDDLRGNDPRRQDRVLRSLYENPKIAPTVQGWIRDYAKGKLAVKDILQDSILILFDDVRSGKFRGDAALSTYLLQICKYRIFNGGKKKSLLTTDSLDVPDTTNRASPAEEQITNLDQEETDERFALRNRLLRSVLKQLSDKCQAELALYYTQNKSTREIADLRDLANAGQAKKSLFRCRNRLRELIAKNPQLQAFLKKTR